MLVTQSCPTFCNPMDCSLPGSSVHGILQARLLECVVNPLSRGSSWARDRTWVFLIAGRFLTVWATGEAPVGFILVKMASIFLFKKSFNEVQSVYSQAGTSQVAQQLRLSAPSAGVQVWSLVMTSHSSVLAWRIPGMGEPGGLPSMGSHRVGHDWSDLAAGN